MAYANYVGQNPYYPQYQGNMMQPQYPNHFVNAMNQNYGQSQFLPQQQLLQNQQQITTQPPIMQPSTNVGSKIIPVSNREEATGTAVDLINGTPSFFYNKSNGEIYLKQFDIPTGKGIFKTYIEAQTVPEETREPRIVNNYEKEIHYLIQGMDNLHRMIAQMQEQRQNPVNIKEINTETIEIEPETKNKKRG